MAPEEEDNEETAAAANGSAAAGSEGAQRLGVALVNCAKELALSEATLSAQASAASAALSAKGGELATLQLALLEARTALCSGIGSGSGARQKSVDALLLHVTELPVRSEAEAEAADGRRLIASLAQQLSEGERATKGEHATLLALRRRCAELETGLARLEALHAEGSAALRAQGSEWAARCGTLEAAYEALLGSKAAEVAALSSALAEAQQRISSDSGAGVTSTASARAGTSRRSASLTAATTGGVDPSPSSVTTMGGSMSGSSSCPAPSQWAVSRDFLFILCLQRSSHLAPRASKRSSYEVALDACNRTRGGAAHGEKSTSSLFARLVTSFPPRQRP